MFHSFAISVANLFNLQEGSHLFEAAVFFVEDTVKILILLFLMMGVMTFLRLHLPMGKIRNFLTKMPFGVAHFFSAILGAVTPFCSCSSLPLFFTFLRAGVPVGATFSFLVTSPIVNEVALVLLWGLFGTKFMLFWLISGLLLGTILGMVFEFLGLEKLLTKDFATSMQENNEHAQKILWEKIKYALSQSIILTKKVIWFILGGVFIGAFIHGFVPENFFVDKISANNIFAVPIATILAVPLYSNASGVIPVVQSLVTKGIPLGTALAFMMAVVGLSLPEAMILKRAMKWRLLAIFFSSVALAIMCIGFLGNLIF